MQKALRKQSTPIIEIEDIERMRIYQQNLIYLIIYERPAFPMGGTNHLANAKIHQEIKDVEIWLKSTTKDFTLNNLRNLKHEKQK